MKMGRFYAVLKNPSFLIGIFIWLVISFFFTKSRLAPGAAPLALIATFLFFYFLGFDEYPNGTLLLVKRWFLASLGLFVLLTIARIGYNQNFLPNLDEYFFVEFLSISDFLNITILTIFLISVFHDVSVWLEKKVKNGNVINNKKATKDSSAQEEKPSILKNLLYTISIYVDIIIIFYLLFGSGFSEIISGSIPWRSIKIYLIFLLPFCVSTFIALRNLEIPLRKYILRTILVSFFGAILVSVWFGNTTECSRLGMGCLLVYFYPPAITLLSLIHNIPLYFFKQGRLRFLKYFFFIVTGVVILSILLYLWGLIFR